MITTKQVYDVNAPSSCNTNLDLTDVDNPPTADSIDLARCPTGLYDNPPPSESVSKLFSGVSGEGDFCSNKHTSGDTQTVHRLRPPLTTKHTHPFGLINPKNSCFLNSVIQAILPILKNTIHTFQFNSSTEGFLTQCFFNTAYNARNSKDVDALKIHLTRYNSFYNGQKQEDSLECLLMLIEIFNKGSIPNAGSITNNCTGVSLSDMLFSFVLEKYIVCDGCGLRSPSF